MVAPDRLVISTRTDCNQTSLHSLSLSSPHTSLTSSSTPIFFVLAYLNYFVYFDLITISEPILTILTSSVSLFSFSTNSSSLSFSDSLSCKRIVFQADGSYIFIFLIKNSGGSDGNGLKKHHHPTIFFQTKNSGLQNPTVTLHSPRFYHHFSIITYTPSQILSVAHLDTSCLSSPPSSSPALVIIVIIKLSQVTSVKKVCMTSRSSLLNILHVNPISVKTTHVN